MNRLFLVPDLVPAAAAVAALPLVVPAAAVIATLPLVVPVAATIATLPLMASAALPIPPVPSDFNRFVEFWTELQLGWLTLFVNYSIEQNKSFSNDFAQCMDIALGLETSNPPEVAAAAQAQTSSQASNLGADEAKAS